jgi:hypothetical protein
MGWETEIADVVAGQPVESVWGNEIRDKLVHVVPTVAGLPTDVADGALAYTEDTDQLHQRVAGTWVRAAGIGSAIAVGSTINQANIALTTGFQTIVSLPLTVPAFWRRFTVQLSGWLSIGGVGGTDSIEYRWNLQGGLILATIVDNGGGTYRSLLLDQDATTLDQDVNTSAVIQARNATSAAGTVITSSGRFTAHRES